MEYLESIRNATETILKMPVVKKYKDKYKPAEVFTDCLYPNLVIYLDGNARKNYFRKTVENIKNMDLVHDVIYETPQDETVSASLIIRFKRKGE